MLRLSNAYIDQAVLSLRTGGRIGTAKQPIFNPNNLKIEGWFADQVFEKGEFILPSSEVRDFITKGIVVNDHEALTLPDDMVRLKDVISLRFELLGKNVVTESKKKLGKVADFAVDDVTNMVQKLYVNPTILRGLTQDQFMIDRSAIVEITDKQITVVDAVVESGAPAFAQAQA